jgi:hypothetical protein
MRLRPMLPVLLLSFALSIVVGVLAAMRGSALTLALAAALFAIQALLALLRINVPLWRRHADATGLDWARDNTLLAALVYAWGAAAMFAIYGLSEIYWRHWWQYGAGMALFAAAALACANVLTRSDAPLGRIGTRNALMGITAAQAAAVIDALIFLVVSGKAASTKPDWAANHVFIAGGVTIAVISLVSLLTWRRLHARTGA